MVENIMEILDKNKILVTKRLKLRPFTLADAPEILQYGSDPETLKYLLWPGVQTLAEAETSVKEYLTSRPGIYAIEPAGEGKCIGNFDLQINETHEKASYGYVLNRYYWNRGFMSETLQAILELSFMALQLNRVESSHFKENPASGKVMVKCGMHYEGTRHQELKVKGRFVDMCYYGVTRAQWLDFKRISPENSQK